MKKILNSCLILLVVFSFSCRETAYLSPFNNNAHYYHTIPLKSDSLKAATYANAAFTFGGANYAWEDDLFSLHTGIDRSFNFGRFQAYGGGDLTLGNYHITKSNPNQNGYTNTDTSVDKFFGAYGFNGAIDYIIPFGDGGEWRVIGLETSFQREFGDYLQFRKSYPDSLARIVQTANWTNTLGIYTEFAWKMKGGSVLGYKIARGGTFVSSKKYLGTEKGRTPVYFSNTIRFSQDRFTGFAQMTIGTYAFSLQAGINCLLSKSNKK